MNIMIIINKRSKWRKDKCFIYNLCLIVNTFLMNLKLINIEFSLSIFEFFLYMMLKITTFHCITFSQLINIIILTGYFSSNLIL